MKVLRFNEIDGIRVFFKFENPTIDPEATKNYIISQIPTGTNDKDLQKTVNLKPVFANPGPNAKFIADSEAEIWQKKQESLKEHQLLSETGEIIPNFKGVKYWLKKDDLWENDEIMVIGVPLPKNVILEESLTDAQYKEIAEQSEKKRIEGLSREQKTKEKEAALSAAKSAVRCLKEEAEIVGESFDAQTEYQSRKTAIEAKYV
jgi:hypothetical protein